MTLLVIKIGTSVLRGTKKITTTDTIKNIANSISNAKRNGDQIIIVSSGAVGLGCLRLGLNKRPTDILSLQASAAIGQGYLMSLYEEQMNKNGFNVAQVLLTSYDLSSMERYKNASMTLKKLIDWDVIPIVNENDTISSEELKYGDNDTLSALVATAVNADKLILLTDVDKLYLTDPKIDLDAEPISDVHNPNELVEINSKITKKGEWGTGGISTKLSAAYIATGSGILVHLADGRDPSSLEGILTGEKKGTVFHPSSKPLKNKKAWLAHALKPLGEIHLDEGACNAIKNKGASVLLVGIKEIKGEFSKNQPVKLIDQFGREVARGLSSLSSEKIHAILGKIKSITPSPIVIHRDVLALTEDNFTI
tara:strand:+ start:1909 stop:3006 length:1098 start_codon:yes stop_codon:yes gene_type:complete